jgi:hypothetical protein
LAMHGLEGILDPSKRQKCWPSKAAASRGIYSCTANHA